MWPKATYLQLNKATKMFQTNFFIHQKKKKQQQKLKWKKKKNRFNGII